MNTARAPFGSIHDRLRQNISLHKAAAIEQTTGKEESISPPGSDAEVKDLLPAGGNPSGRGVHDLTSIGAGAKEKLPGVKTDLPTEELERQETDPDTKLAGIDPSIIALQERLAGNIKIAADFFAANPNGIAAPVAKVAGEITSLGEVQAPTDAALSSTNKSDTSGAPVVVRGVTGVSQASPSSGVADVGAQGTQEKAASAMNPADLDAVAAKVASFTQDYNAGRSVAQAIMAKLAAPSPEEMDREKLAEVVQGATVLSTANSLMGAGVEHGIITSKQADDLMSLLGLRVNPLHAAIENVQHKMAELVQSPICTNEQKIAFLSKIAEEDPMAAAGAPEGAQPPVDPEQLKAAIAQLLQELQAAVQSGQMTEEQALGLLQELGIPLDAPGGDPAAEGGGAPPPAAAEAVPEGEPDGDEGKKASIVAHNRAVFGLKLAALLSSKEIAALNPMQHDNNLFGLDGTSLGIGGGPVATHEAPVDKASLNLSGVAPHGGLGGPVQSPMPDTTQGIPGITPNLAKPNTAPINLPEAPAAAPAAGGINWPLILGGLGVGGLGALAYKGLSGDEEEERHKRKHAEASDPAMAAQPAPGGDPAAAGAPGGGGPEQIIQELMTLIQSGQIKPEEGVQIIQELASSDQIPPEVAEQLLAMLQGGAGGAPPPEAAGTPVA